MGRRVDIAQFSMRIPPIKEIIRQKGIESAIVVGIEVSPYIQPLLPPYFPLASYHSLTILWRASILIRLDKRHM
jgi:hypothetical protein